MINFMNKTTNMAQNEKARQKHYSQSEIHFVTFHCDSCIVNVDNN